MKGLRFFHLQSLRSSLLWGILLPITLLITLNFYSLYQDANAAANAAYDRTLLASAKSIGEQLDVEGYDEQATLSASVAYSAMEPFEADNQSNLYYRVSDMRQRFVSGHQDLPIWLGTIPQKSRYAALVDFYDDHYDGKEVRIAVLLQPVVSATGRGMAVIQVAETLELRHNMATEILRGTFLRQLILLAVIALVVIWAVQRATKPVRQLSAELIARDPNNLEAISADELPKELQPIVDASNSVMRKLQTLISNQKRFVRDAAHQLRTPLAVLKVQVQSGLRGDAAPQVILQEIAQTTERATQLANQMLALAKVDQLRYQGTAPLCAWDDIVREIALELSPLIVEKNLDFDIDTDPCSIHAHDWMLRELSRNILHNAIAHSKVAGFLHIRLQSHPEGEAVLSVVNASDGLSEELQQRLFQAFSAGNTRQGSGLGLAICIAIVDALQGQISIQNRYAQDQVTGVVCTVKLKTLG